MSSESLNNNKLSRRKFLRLAALGALMSLTPAGIIEAREPQKYDLENERTRLEEIKNLRIKYSVPLEEINPQIRFMLNTGFVLDFLSIPEIKQALSNPDFRETILQIIKVLSVESQESAIYMNKRFDMQMDPEFRNLNRVRNFAERLIKIREKLKAKEASYELKHESETLDLQREYQIFVSEWKICYPDKKVPTMEEIEKMVKDFAWKAIDVGYKYVQEYRSLHPAGDPNYPQFELTVPEPVESWQNNGDFTCNIYASSFIACLGLQNRFSHRVDELQRPVIYKKDERTGKVGFYVEEDGRLVQPKGQVRELRAAGQIEWLSTIGVKEHGWIDVTDLGYDEKVKMLSEGYVFVGGNGEHNWVIVGLEINGKMEPVLTQSSDFVSVKLFLPKEQIANSRYILGESVQNNSSYTEPNIPFARPYKLLPNIEECPEGTKLFAIKAR